MNFLAFINRMLQKYITLVRLGWMNKGIRWNWQLSETGRDERKFSRQTRSTNDSSVEDDADYELGILPKERK